MPLVDMTVYSCYRNPGPSLENHTIPMCGISWPDLRAIDFVEMQLGGVEMFRDPFSDPSAAPKGNIVSYLRRIGSRSCEVMGTQYSA